MDLYNSLKAVIDFFIQPFLKALDEIGISEMDIRLGFSNVEWFSIKLYDLISLVGSYIILYLFFRIIFKILKMFIKIIMGGVNVWKKLCINLYSQLRSC